MRLVLFPLDSHSRYLASEYSTSHCGVFCISSLWQSSAMDPKAIRKKFGRFRALVIGRANAGKTTILRCIAQSADGRVSVSFSVMSVMFLNCFRLTHPQECVN